jgi:hypothetical protein
LQIVNKDLLSQLSGGGTLIVPSSQRAAAVRFAHARAALAAGQQVWETAASSALNAAGTSTPPKSGGFGAKR